MINGKILVHLRACPMTQSGYGAHSREVLNFLLQDERFIVALESVNWGHCGFLHKEDFKDEQTFHKYRECMVIYEQVKDREKFDLSIQVTIPNEFERRAQINIGVTAGIETSVVAREWIHKCNEMDIIVVPSMHSGQVLAGTTFQIQNEKTGETRDERVSRPIFVIPEYYEPPEEFKPLDIKFSTKKNLLHVGQWGNKGGFGEDRKNIGDLIKWFYEAFEKDAQAGLVLKVQSVNGSAVDRAEIKKRLEEIKGNFKNPKCKVYLIHQDLTDEQMWALYKHPRIQGMISLTHGEGFGRPLLEAAFAGLPVLATNWSGHLDFLKKGEGFIPIDFEMVDVPACQVWEGVIIKESKWARVDQKDTQKKMRKFLDGPKKIQKEAEAHISWLQENFSKEAVHKKWKEFFSNFIRDNSGEVNESPQAFAETLEDPHNPKNNPAVQKLLSLVDTESKKKRAIYIIPQSAGDCLMSTAIVDSLIKSRHWDTDYDFYVATSPQFKPLFSKLEEDFGVKLIDYDHNLMFQADLLKEVFDYVYSPGINVQYNFSNWLLGNGEYSVRLLEELAKNCNLHPSELTNYQVSVEECEIPSREYIVVHSGGQKSAKTYKYWPDVIRNLHEMVPDADIVQIGTTDEALLDGVLDYRGKSFAQSFYVIQNAQLLIGPDSFPAHAAAAMETPHLVIYGSTHGHTCAPVLLGKKTLQIAIEGDRCDPKCYKDTCRKAVNGEKNCLSHISAKSICSAAFMMLEKITKKEEEDES